jgi:DNA polymerase-3 subunit epsilon
MPRTWVAIDFETANERSSSVCALGLAVIRDRHVAECSSWLIRPPENRFNYHNVRVHGITEDDVEDAPEFCEVWDEIAPRLDGCALLAHNAAFDVGVLRAVLDVYGLEWPDVRYWCTVRMSRAVWPQLPDHRLGSVADHCGIEFRHHDAVQDAEACAGIALRCSEDIGARDLNDAVRRLRLAGRRL